MALSGGLYLIGIKGTIDQTRIGIAGFGEQLLAELLDKKPLRARMTRFTLFDMIQIRAAEDPVPNLLGH